MKEDSDSKRSRRRFPVFAALALCLVSAALTASGQTTTPQPSPTPRPTPRPAPKPEPTPEEAQTPYGTTYEPLIEGRPVHSGNYWITSSIELGARGLSVDGNRDKYRSDVNYRAGFRLFESSLLVRSDPGKGILFDSLVVNSTGWGADPYGYLRVNAEKGRWYRFDATFRRNNYDNFLRNLALGQHTARYQHNLGDFDLWLLPTNRRVRFNLGYSGDRESGPGTITYDFQRDEFQIGSNFKTRANEFRAGVEGRVGGVNLGFLQGFRWYRNDSTYFSGFNRGNNTTNASVLSSLQRDQPMRGRAAFTRLSATTTVDKKVDITARYTYTTARTHFLDVETSTGVNSSANPFNPDLINFSGTTERPAHLFDLGVTWRATKRLRVQDTFRFNRFTNSGDEVYSELVFTRRPNGTPVAPFPAATTVPISRLLEYRRALNQVMFDYQFGPRLAVHAGWRITERRIESRGVGQLLPAPVSASATSEERTDTTNNSFFGGLRARPTKRWAVYFDAEKGQADNTFTRVDNINQLSFRGRTRWTPRRGLSFNANFVTRDNHNPGVGVIDRTIFGPLDSTPFSVDINSRTFGGSVDYTPDARLSLSAGYTHLRVTSDAEILYFAGLPGNRIVTGRSLYFLRDHFFYFNALAQVHRRVTAFASYRINDDAGQGSRSQGDISTGLFVRSLPFTFQTPEVKLIFKLGRRVDWNVGYQYYAYREKPPFNTGQDYRAHLPYTSLRIYFGGGER